MKQFLAAAFLLVAFSFCYAISVDEVIQLSKLKTSDDVIIDTIRSSGLDERISATDVVRMKQEGVSDAVIQALLDMRVSKDSGPAYRVYEVVGKDGKKTKMVTNMDESGNRMGPPPSAPPPEIPFAEEPKESIVTIRHEPPARAPEPDEEYIEGPMYGGGIPLDYGYSSYGSPFFPNYLPYQGFYPGHTRNFDPTQLPAVYPRPPQPHTWTPTHAATQRRPDVVVRGSTAGTRR